MHRAQGPRRTWISYGGIAAFAFAAMAGCGGGDSDGGGGGDPVDCSPRSDTATPFIAFCGHFQNYRSWEAFHIPDDGAQGSVHLAGPKTDYLNKRPPKGSTEFPVGTIIVKELETGPIGQRKVFAMVKRGAGYNNASTVPNWEWFELQNNGDGSVRSIVWHGFGPPAGESYGGDKTACTTCHGNFKNNDYVQSLSLSNL